MTDRVSVTVTRWHLGWELELDRGGVTQARTLDVAEQQVRDYLDTVDPATPHDRWVIDVDREAREMQRDRRWLKPGG